MSFVSLFILFLVFIVPGFVAQLVLENIYRRPLAIGTTAMALIFDLLILINNLIGLYFIKHIFTVQDLTVYFNCLSFTFKYAILSIIVGIVIAVIVGIIFRFTFVRKS